MSKQAYLAIDFTFDYHSCRLLSQWKLRIVGGPNVDNMRVVACGGAAFETHILNIHYNDGNSYYLRNTLLFKNT